MLLISKNIFHTLNDRHIPCLYCCIIVVVSTVSNIVHPKLILKIMLFDYLLSLRAQTHTLQICSVISQNDVRLESSSVENTRHTYVTHEPSIQNKHFDCADQKNMIFKPIIQTTIARPYNSHYNSCCSQLYQLFIIFDTYLCIVDITKRIFHSEI